MVHGDDFVLVGPPAALAWAKREMDKSFLTKVIGTLGCGPDEVDELRILNRVVRWGQEGIKYEADPRHADVLCAGLAGTAPGVSTPGTASKDMSGDEDEALSETEAASTGRSRPGRCTWPSTGRTSASRQRSFAAACGRRAEQILRLSAGSVATW